MLPKSSWMFEDWISSFDCIRWLNSNVGLSERNIRNFKYKFKNFRLGAYNVCHNCIILRFKTYPSRTIMFDFEDYDKVIALMGSPSDSDLSFIKDNRILIKDLRKELGIC
jgi:hypothetical protein